MIYFDAHVHIQKSVNLDHLFAAAGLNFCKQLQVSSPGKPATFFLLLAETTACDCFNDLQTKIAATKDYKQGKWQLLPTMEKESLLVIHEDWPENRLFVLAGRQLITAERLEVLALATKSRTAEGLTLSATVDSIRQQAGLAVLPWGAGKWLGKRGRLVEAYLKDTDPKRLFVGDNGGRPTFWPTPSPFRTAAKRGIRLLPGSDPLPLPGEERRIGSYGAMLAGECSSSTPAADLKALLTGSNATLTPFGDTLGALSFIKTQLALRRQKR